MLRAILIVLLVVFPGALPAVVAEDEAPAKPPAGEGPVKEDAVRENAVKEDAAKMVLEKAVASMGGDEALAKIRAVKLSYQGTYRTETMKTPFRSEMLFVRPDRMLWTLDAGTFKGAVGTSASYADLIGPENLKNFEAELGEKLKLPFYPIATQTYPRKQEYRILSALAGLGASIHKFAYDLRILQSPPYGEWSEPFRKKQVGSSAMPFKRNPINAEKLDSLCRYLAQLPRVAWDNAANSLLERTLDDSANRRSLLPEAFLIVDELLGVSHKVLSGLVINQNAIQKNLETYGPFAATERVLMALVKKGADRQKMHEKIREHTMQAWEAVKAGIENPLNDTIIKDPEFLSHLSSEEIAEAMNASTYTGNAKVKALGICNTKSKFEKWLENHSSMPE